MSPNVLRFELKGVTKIVTGYKQEWRYHFYDYLVGTGNRPKLFHDDRAFMTQQATQPEDRQTCWGSVSSSKSKDCFDSFLYP